jgi:hypothetical protein
MKPCILVAAPSPVDRRLAEAFAPTFAVMSCTDREHAVALIEVASFQAIVVVDGFVSVPPHLDDDAVIHVDVDAEPAAIRDAVAAAVERRKVTERQHAADFAMLPLLSYDEYLELVRYRATRQYLLALMHRHHGGVTGGARTAGVMRESLHRMLRRHDVDAERFRARHARDRPLDADPARAAAAHCHHRDEA